MSNKPSDIYEKQWGKMVKLITIISDSMKEYISTADNQDIPSHENLLMAMQVFSLICGEKWQYDNKKMDELWAASKEVHRLVKLSKDTTKKGQLQEPASHMKRGNFKN